MVKLAALIFLGVALLGGLVDRWYVIWRSKQQPDICAHCGEEMPEDPNWSLR